MEYFPKRIEKTVILYHFKPIVLFRNPKKHYICSRIQNAKPNKNFIITIQ